MSWTRKRLELDWFIPKDVSRSFDSIGLVDFLPTYNDRFIVLLAPQ